MEETGAADVEADGVRDPQLRWDDHYEFNEEGRYCYCGEDRKLGEVAVQCSVCMQWFHARCTSAPVVKELSPLQRNYTFVCSNCAITGCEYCALCDNSWKNVAETAIANLALNEAGDALELEGKRTKRFRVKEDIIAWVVPRFDSLARGRELHKLLDQSALEKCVHNGINSDMFDVDQEKRVGLARPDQFSLRPIGGLKGAPIKPKAEPAKEKRPAEAPKAPPAKRKRTSQPAKRDDRRRERHAPAVVQLQVQDLPERHRMVPVVRCAEMSGVVQDPSVVQLSVAHKAAQLRVSRASSQDDSFLCAAGHKGYRSVCATHAVGSGTWFFEVAVGANVGGPGPFDGQCRLGWATELATPDAPAGYDEHSFSYRSRLGTAFHQSRGMHYGSPYATGDVIGCLISLPEASTLPRQRPRLTLKTAQYLIVDLDQRCGVNEGSSVTFYKNGELQGVAFRDVPAEWYYPAVSLFGDAQVTVNFGPDFDQPPKELPDSIESFQPMCNVAAEDLPDPEDAQPGVSQ